MFSLYAKRLLNGTVPNRMRHRIARPRGGRRPSPQTRPLTPQSASPLSQSFPAPSWGTVPSTNSASMQQPAGNFTFGQQPGTFSSSSNNGGASSSFPSFGGQNTNSTQQLTAPSSSGFGFNAPNMSNPFASSNQPATSSGFSGSIFNLPSQTPAAPKSPPKIPASEMKTPSHWMKESDLPDAYRTKDPQSFFVPHAPFKWGQPDPPEQQQSQQAAAESNTNATDQQNAQTPSTSSFEQNSQLRQPTSNIFGHLQQHTLPSSNPFGQQPSQQSQTFNMLGQKTASPFQTQPNQNTPNLLGQQSTSQTQNSTNVFGQTVTSPTKDGDSMSTTPDTSPQANNDRARLGPFASATAPSKETLTNGATPAGSRSGVFGASFQSSGDQGTKPTNDPAAKEPASDEGSHGHSGQASDVSLGSPTKKNRNIAPPRIERPHIEEEAAAKNPFAGSNLPAPKPSTFASPPSFPTSSASTQQQSFASFQTNGTMSSLFPQPAVGDLSTPRSRSSRRPGEPPEPPADFMEEQKRQLTTGWRLKCLDVGLQSYLHYSTFDTQEIESIKNFYQLRKQAILSANGGPLPEVGNKRAAESEQGQTGFQSKRARHERVERPNRSANLSTAANSSPGKRKANEDLHETDEDSSTNAFKRSKGAAQFANPSLPSTSSSSQTSKMFGNLVGKQGPEGLSDDSNLAVNGHSSTGVIAGDPAPPSKPSFSQSGLLFKAPASSASAFEPSLFANSNKQNSFFKFGSQPVSTSVQSNSEQQKTSSQAPSTPFKGFIPDPIKPGNENIPFNSFFPSQINNVHDATMASSSSTTAQGLSAAHSSDTSSIFSRLNNGANKTNVKRKADESGGEEVDVGDSNPQRSEEQPSKKQKAGEGLTGTSDSDRENISFVKQPATTERPGFGASIFSRPSAAPASNSNPFIHLAKSSEQSVDDLPDYEDDEDENPSENGKGTQQQNQSSASNQTSELFNSNRSRSPVYNPLASASFLTPPKHSTEGEKPPGRSFFERIEKDKEGQPFKGPQPTNFGQSILKTPARQKTGDSFDQAKASGTNPFGAANSTFGSKIFGYSGSHTSRETPSTAPTSNPFSRSSGSNDAPVTSTVGDKSPGDSPSGDNTWKPQTPIKFGTSTTASAPSISFTSPSPAKAPFTGLFGASKANTSSESMSPFNFKPADSSWAKPAPLTFGISAPAKEPNESLAPPSGTQSESTSRATSPGGTDTEGGNEASDVVHDKESTPELDTTEAAKAEADEDAVFNAKARLYKFDTSAPDKANHKWVLQGTESLRVLKHRETNKTRVLMRLKMGKVILNTGLQKNLSYVHAGAKRVTVPVPASGKVETWLISLAKDDDAKKLAGVLEENKVY